MKRRSIFLALAVLAVTILSSCGGGGGGTFAGIGGTGITSSGSITGIGSIYVNGVEYNVDSAAITVNGNVSSTPAELKVGMVVTVTGTLDSAGSTTGTANTVVYDNEIQGPVVGKVDPNGDGLTWSFTIMGQTVVVSSTATVFEDEKSGNSYDFLTIQDGHYIEVSGFVDQNGTLQATRVEKKISTEVELKGTVTGCPLPSGCIAGMSFTLGTITVDIVAGTTDTSDIPGGVITDGMQVEVKGSLAGTATIIAIKIELDDDGLGSDLNGVSLEGIVTEYGGLSSFKVAGQLVDASSASLEPSNLVLANGVKIEVEGDIVNGILVATDVEARSGKIILHATVSDVSGSTITMGYYTGTVPVLVDNKTSFKDGLTLSGIVAGVAFLEIEGYQDSADNVIASQVKRNSLDNDLIQGPVDGPLSGGGTITVLGIQYVLDITTNFSDQNEQSQSNSQFFANLIAGDTVKIEDDVSADGIANEVEPE